LEHRRRLTVHLDAAALDPQECRALFPPESGLVWERASVLAVEAVTAENRNASTLP
jgi:hypothetical protein